MSTIADSPIHIYAVRDGIKEGSTNHKYGSVSDDAIIPAKITSAFFDFLYTCRISTNATGTSIASVAMSDHKKCC